jgi:hypothetical protein
MRALLDVNVLIALLDADHTLHTRATTWFASNAHARLGVLPDYAKRLHPHHVASQLPEWATSPHDHGTLDAGERELAPRLLA